LGKPPQAACKYTVNPVSYQFVIPVACKMELIIWMGGFSDKDWVLYVTGA